MELQNDETFISIPQQMKFSYCCTVNNENDLRSNMSPTNINAFGFQMLQSSYQRAVKININQQPNIWLLFDPCEKLKQSENEQKYHRIPLKQQNVTLSFGTMVSPHKFKCAKPTYFFRNQSNSTWNLVFDKFSSYISINTETSEYKIKQNHIDANRGVVIDRKTPQNVVVNICLRGNPDEYALMNAEEVRRRRFYFQTLDNQLCQPRFSVLRLSMKTKRMNDYCVHKALCLLIQFFSHHSIPIYFGSIEFSEQEFIDCDYHDLSQNNSFTCQYAQNLLFSTDYRLFDQIVNENDFHNRIPLCCRMNDNYYYYVMERLRRMAVTTKPFINLSDEAAPIIDGYRFYLESTFYKTDQSWPNYVRIPWFRITPACFIVKPYKFMKSNRVFRHLSSVVTKAIAFVEFRDDTNSSYLSKELVPFLERYLRKGFTFNDRHYIYLHHAQSQVRNKQFYFYCEREGGITREQLENWMGNFDGERVPAKNTARRTQPFSSTEPTIEVKSEMVDRIPDIMTTDKKYNFTDGVGQISTVLNRLIHQAIGVDIDSGEYISSVLQIRYAGCKGIVAVNSKLDRKQKQLLIRPSMEKFECNHQILELCKRSLRRNLCLNREVINLLSYRGISSQCLLMFQLRNIHWLTLSLLSNRSAVEVLQEKVLNVFCWDRIARYLDLSKESFFRRLLHRTIANNLLQLVNRAHIRVPKARYMFGTVDEHNVLKSGEVFVQITDRNGKKTILAGPIAITKNPCHHPGDLRVLKCVDHECLHDLYDVLVFPQQGARPHSSEISGSDLDGDEYSVIWDPELVPISPNPEPYLYDSGPAAKPLNRVVNRDDRIKVILDICEQNNIGRLSNLHLITTDKFGIDSSDATKLAAAVSQELDSVKTGQHPYTLQEIEKLNQLTGKKRPDFMKTVHYPQYVSHKVLGQLFRSVQRMNELFTNRFSEHDENETIQIDTNLLHDGYERYIDFAHDLYKRYQNEIFEVLGSYGFANEIDLFCCIESSSIEANDRNDIQTTVQTFLKAVFKDIQKRFHEKNYCTHGEQKSKAAACYYVAYTDQNYDGRRMLSFPWLFVPQLLSIENLNDSEREIVTILSKTFHAYCEALCTDETNVSTDHLERIIQILLEQNDDDVN